MIVAVDIGSGSVRAGLVTEDGVAHIARRPGALRTTAGPLRGVDLAALRARVSDALAEVAAVAHERGIRVDTLTCTAVRYATVWSRAEDPHAIPAMTWANLARADRRDVDDLQSALTEDDVAALGGWPTSLSLASRMASAQRWGIAPPEGTVPLSLAGWLLGTWGARPHIDDVSWADGRVDAGDGLWDLPVLSPGTTVGEYAGPVRQWRGARVSVSPPDTVAALHAFDDLAVGDAVAVAGTTTPVVALADAGSAAKRKVTDNTSWLPFTSGVWLAESNAARTGDAVSGVAGLVDEPLGIAARSGGERRTMARIGAVRSFLGPTLVAPRWLGERAPTQAIEFQVALAEATREDVAQSATDANAWATDVHLRRVVDQAGAEGRRIVCGGQSRSVRFLAMLAAAGGQALEAVTDEVTLLGAAVAASGRNIAQPERATIHPEFDVGQEPSQWAARWWERYNAPVPGKRVYA